MTARRLFLAAAAAANFGCVPLVPIPVAVPVTDRPPALQPLPPDFSATGEAVLVLASTLRGAGVLLDEPMFIRPHELASVEERLGRINWHGAVIMAPLVGPPVQFSVKSSVVELCFVDQSGRALTLLRSGDTWDASQSTVMSAGWQQEFVDYLLQEERDSPAALWHSGPCTGIDLGGVRLTWNAEQRRRVAAFLAKLPLR